jgi:hypothetical protein
MDLLRIILQNTKDIQKLKKEIICCANSGGDGTVTSVGITVPSAFSVAGSPITTSGILAITGAGTTSQYIRGDGTLATFPSVIGTANNGLSLSGSNFVLGQDVSQVGAPATLLSNREIPMSTFTVRMTDASTNVSTFGAGTIVSTRTGGGTNYTGSNTITTNVGINGASLNTTVTFGSFNNYTAGAYPYLGVKRFNTLAAGTTISTTTSNRQSVFYGALQFENDVAANSNTITVAGPQPISVFASKIDLWPSANNQVKVITGALTSYNSFFDAANSLNSTIETLIDYQAGPLAGNASLSITNRYGFRVIDLGSSTATITNRWAFAQEGTTDKNWFAGFSGFGLNNATARVHVAAGTATVAPVIITPGVVLTTPVNGALETDGTNLYFTVGGVRKIVTLV